MARKRATHSQDPGNGGRPFPPTGADAPVQRNCLRVMFGGALLGGLHQTAPSLCFQTCLLVRSTHFGYECMIIIIENNHSPSAAVCQFPFPPEIPPVSSGFLAECTEAGDFWPPARNISAGTSALPPAVPEKSRCSAEKFFPGRGRAFPRPCQTPGVLVGYSHKQESGGTARGKGNPWNITAALAPPAGIWRPSPPCWRRE